VLRIKLRDRERSTSDNNGHDYIEQGRCETCRKDFEIDELLKNDFRTTSSTYRNNVNVDTN